MTERVWKRFRLNHRVTRCVQCPEKKEERKISVANTLAFILNHPLNKGRPIKALSRFVGWQLKSRISGGDIVPFVENTRLLVTRGMSGATGNVYCGLVDFAEMGFVLHVLRANDLFFDVGANVGVYTVVAGVTGARCMAFEPVHDTYRALVANIDINGLGNARAWQCALGEQRDLSRFTTDQGTVNHAVADGEDAPSVLTPVHRLDDFWPANEPEMAVLKIDVEGYEREVAAGGEKVLTHPATKAVIMEILNGQACRYGFDDWKLHEKMLGWGFRLHHYDPFSRALTETEEVNGGNNLYVRDAEAVRQRLSSVPKYLVHGTRV